MVGNTVTASSSFFARSVQSLKSSSHPFHASWILGSAQKSALALTPVSRPAARAACPALNTDRWAWRPVGESALARRAVLVAAASIGRPFTRFQQHFLGNWLFFPTVRTSLKSALSSNSVFDAQWGKIIFEFVFMQFFVWHMRFHACFFRYFAIDK